MSKILAFLFCTVAHGNQQQELVDLLQVVADDLIAVNATSIIEDAAQLNTTTGVIPIAFAIGALKLLAAGVKASGAHHAATMSLSNAAHVAAKLADKACDIILEEYWIKGWKSQVKAAPKTMLAVEALSNELFSDGQSFEQRACQYSAWCHESAAAFWWKQNEALALSDPNMVVSSFNYYYDMWDNEAFRSTSEYNSILAITEPAAGKNCFDEVDKCNKMTKLQARAAARDQQLAAERSENAAQFLEAAEPYMQASEVAQGFLELAEASGINVASHFGISDKTFEHGMANWESLNSWGFSILMKAVKNAKFGLPCESGMVMGATAFMGRRWAKEELEEAEEKYHHGGGFRIPGTRIGMA